MTNKEQTRLARLRALATEFRRAIEQAPPRALGSSLGDFPHGACGDATDLLGNYLIESSEGTFDYFLGERGSMGSDHGWHSHAWLQQGSITIDITADQFPEIQEPEIVADSPTDFHRTFEADIDHVADYRLYDRRTANILGAAYRRIKARLAQGDEGGVPEGKPAASE